MKAKKATSIYLCLLAPLIYFAVFLHLDSLPFRPWDESYLAVHAYEMMDDHDYIVTHTFHEPEMSNTKPPFAIWCMAASCSIFGFNELSIRLPNALAAVIVSLTLFFFMARMFRSPLTGFLSVLVLITSGGYVTQHVVRSGEYDSLLVLFIALFSLSFFVILEPVRDSTRRRVWFVFTISVILAILTKGIAALLIAPGLFIYALIQKKVLWLIKSKEVYISIFVILFFGVGYYFLREHYNPGYLQAVYDNELGGRYAKTNEDHGGTVWFYLEAIAGTHFAYWLPFAFVGIFSLRSEWGKQFKNLIVFCTIVVVVFLIVLTSSATKIYWYDAPAIPFLSILAGIGIYLVISTLYGWAVDEASSVPDARVLLLVLLLAMPPYISVITKNQYEEEITQDNPYNIMYFLRKQEAKNYDLNGSKMLIEGWMMRDVACEIRKRRPLWQHITVVSAPPILTAGDRIITTHDAERHAIDEQYTHETIDRFENIEMWQIINHKASLQP